MALNNTAGSGLVKSLREVATTERLRSDHIMTLELMQDTIDENSMLKDVNKKLLARLNRLGDDGIINDDNSDENVTDNTDAGSSALTKKLLKQEEELASLRTENKLLKGQARQDERRIKELQRSNNSNDALRRELDALKAEAAKQMPANDVISAESETALKAQIQDLTEKLLNAAEQLDGHVPGCMHRIAELEASLQSATSHASTSAEGSEQRYQQAQEQIAALEAQLDALLNEEEGHIQKYHLLETKYKELRKLSDGGERVLRDKLHESNLKHEALVTAAENAQRNLQEKEDTLQQLLLTNASLEKQVAELLARPQAQPNPLLLQPDTDDSTTFFLTGDGGKASGQVQASAVLSKDMSFDEFVRLRKEVKSLKVQLLELSQAKSSSKIRGSASTVFSR